MTNKFYWKKFAICNLLTSWYNSVPINIRCKYNSITHIYFSIQKAPIVLWLLNIYINFYKYQPSFKTKSLNVFQKFCSVYQAVGPHLGHLPFGGIISNSGLKVCVHTYTLKWTFCQKTNLNRFLVSFNDFCTNSCRLESCCTPLSPNLKCYPRGAP